MLSQSTPLLLSFAFCVLAFDELLHVNGELPVVGEMVEKGRLQYQLLQERGKLPKYGACWKQAIEHIEESCRALSEESQSDVALHITNCFLEMSGHKTYDCGMDKKPNLRAICINTMSDRAFLVYTEFYTHAQNICWFLRGQMWQETIVENTHKVGKQLDKSARNQEDLLKNQEASLQLQERIMKYGLHLEKILENFQAKSQEQYDILEILTSTVSSLQSWLIGEISWFDSVVFYLLSSMAITFITSTPYTFSARLPILLLFTSNLLFERLLCQKMNKEELIDARIVQRNYHNFVWYLRYTFVGIAFIILIVSFYKYKDYLVENNQILETIRQEVQELSAGIKKIPINSDVYQNENEFDRNSSLNSVSELDGYDFKTSLRGRRRRPIIVDYGRYNLRSRQGTPDSALL